MPKDKKNLHVKPTPEELEANTQKALEEAEKLKDKKEPPKEVKPPKKTEKPEEPKTVKTPEPDYKKKFIASTKEGQILHAKNKKTNEAIAQAMETPEPTEEELKKEYSDWDEMSQFEKKMAKDGLANTRRFQALEGIVKETKNLESWQKKVDEFADDPKTLVDNPELDGRQDEFRLFATKPTRRGVDFKDLVSAFLYDATQKAPPKKKGKMFETGSGGPNAKPKSGKGKITLEEARQLREADYPKFKEYLKAGKIEEPDYSS